MTGDPSAVASINGMNDKGLIRDHETGTSSNSTDRAIANGSEAGQGTNTSNSANQPYAADIVNNSGTFIAKTYTHPLPIKVKVENNDNTDEYDLIHVDVDTRGRDVKMQIINSEEFELTENFNVLVTYNAILESGRVRRRMLTDKARIPDILSRLPDPNKQCFFFANYITVDVDQPDATIAFTIRVYHFTIDHLREQIEKYSDTKGVSYKIFSVNENSRKTIVEQDTIHACCINGVKLWVEREIEVSVGETQASPSVPRPIQAVPDLETNDFDCMLSYSWSTKEQVYALYDALKEELPGIRIWLDHDQMSGNINKAMAKGVLKSTAIIVCLSPDYLISKNCLKEINFADENKKPIIPAYMFASLSYKEIQEMKKNSNLAEAFVITSGKLYADFKDSVKGSTVFQDAVSTIVHGLKNLVPRLQDPVAYIHNDIPVTPKITLKTWLNPVDFEYDLVAYQKDFVLGTRIWLKDEVCSWARDSNQPNVLWTYGAAGTGKSLFSYFISQHLPQEEFITSTFFFCRHNDDQKNDPLSLVKTIIWMLSEQFTSFKEYIETFMQEEEKEKKGTRQHTQGILSEPFNAFEKLVIGGLKKVSKQGKIVLITIDALDELHIKTRSSILKILTELCERLPDFVKVFVTGRPEKDIYECLTKLNSLELESTNEENLNDISLVVGDRLKTIWNSDQLNSEMFLVCEQLVIDKSEGLFIYVKLICEFLTNHQFNMDEAVKAIENFQAGPDGVYAAIANVTKQAVGEVNQKLYYNVLGAILFVAEPLTLQHLSFFADTSLEDTVGIFDKMRSILKVVDGKISIVHKSVKDYFTSLLRSGNNLYISGLDANALLASKCLDAIASYLRDTWDPKFPPQWKIRDLPFLPKYSFQNLRFHLNISQSASNLGSFCLEFGPKMLLQYASENGSSNLVMTLLEEYQVEVDGTDNDLWTPLMFAAEKGHIETITLLLSHGAKVNAKEKHGWTPLIVAAENGQTETVRLLLSSGADVDTTNNYGKTPLMFSAQFGHTDTTMLLLSCGANLNAKDSNMRTPLLFAAQNGRTEIVTQLLSCGAVVDAKSSDGQTPLIVAADGGHTETVMILLSHGAEVDVNKNIGLTPLMNAVLIGHNATVTLLLLHGADVNIMDYYGCTPLMYAVKFGYTETISLLLSHGADVNTKNDEGWTPLMNVAEKGDTDTVKYLISCGADVNSKSNAGWTPLMVATENAFTQTIKLLLLCGAEVNTKSNNEETALLLATKNNCSEIIALLLSLGADVNAHLNFNLTPLMYAAGDGDTDIVRLLLSYGADVNATNNFGQTSIIEAARGGNSAVVSLLLSHGADVHVKTRNKETPLMLAARNGYTVVVKCLVSHGGEINVKDNYGWTPLMYSVQNNYIETAILLISHGADVNAKNGDGRNPLILASQNGQSKTVTLLVSHGADVNVSNNDGWTPLMYAAQNGHIKTVILLVSHGAEMNAKNDDGRSTLMSAAVKGHTETVAFLLSQGADVNAKDNDGWTPLTYAAQNGYTETVTLMISSGADVDAKNTEGRTPIMFAAQNDHTETVKLLLSSGANLNAKDIFGWTPLMFALETESIDTIKLLRSYGTEAAKDPFASTQLMIAVQNKHLENEIVTKTAPNAKCFDNFNNIPLQNNIISVNPVTSVAVGLWRWLGFEKV